jgi:hypothetical protein
MRFSDMRIGDLVSVYDQHYFLVLELVPGKEFTYVWITATGPFDHHHTITYSTPLSWDSDSSNYKLLTR